MYIDELAKMAKEVAGFKPDAIIDDDEIDTTLVIEQLLEDLYMAYYQIRFTTNRI